jgi:hypothetical protein
MGGVLTGDRQTSITFCNAGRVGSVYKVESVISIPYSKAIDWVRAFRETSLRETLMCSPNLENWYNSDTRGGVAFGR